ncbi:MAG: recombinase family protein, partial [Alphaproteobacteria bacterium]|nr:recombinase family protein [Alphaproteobacteria bacterium]
MSRRCRKASITPPISVTRRCACIRWASGRWTGKPPRMILAPWPMPCARHLRPAPWVCRPPGPAPISARMADRSPAGSAIGMKFRSWSTPWRNLTPASSKSGPMFPAGRPSAPSWKSCARWRWDPGDRSCSAPWRPARATILARALADERVITKQGKPINKGYLYRLLNNRVYIGEAVHKGSAYPGQHEAIITWDLWNKVRSILKESPRVRSNHTRAQTPALLKGLIFGADGRAMTPVHTRKGDRLYRYYVAAKLLKAETADGVIRRVAAAEIEAAVIDQVRGLLCAPEVVVATWRAGRETDGGLTEAEVREALRDLDQLWDELFPGEQARVLRLLVERVEFHPDGLNLRFRVDGLQTLVA